jgi:hypothetical protein
MIGGINDPTAGEQQRIHRGEFSWRNGLAQVRQW